MLVIKFIQLSFKLLSILFILMCTTIEKKFLAVSHYKGHNN